jgi:hypothetical protein
MSALNLKFVTVFSRVDINWPGIVMIHWQIMSLLFDFFATFTVTARYRGRRRSEGRGQNRARRARILRPQSLRRA